MSDSFGASAAQLYGLAARALGWRPDDFWLATPAELVAALGPPTAAPTLDRTSLNRMMEHDDG